MERDKYKGIDPNIAKELAAYEFRYFRRDEPVPFCGMLIYPATVKDYESFLDAMNCLTLDKNTTLAGLKMSNLEYLAQKMSGGGEDPTEGPLWSYRFTRLLDICLHIKSGYKCPKCGKVLEFGSVEATAATKLAEESAKTLLAEHPELAATEEGIGKLREAASPKCPVDGDKLEPTVTIRKDEKGKLEFVLDGHVVNSEDFNRLRQIILFQNLPDYRDESWVDPALKKDREMKMELERKNNDVHATVEKKVVCLSISTHYKFDEIYDMPIRKFSMALSTVDDLINYKITKLAYMTGLVTPPKGKTLEHWIYKPDKDMYGDDYKSLDSAQADAAQAGR